MTTWLIIIISALGLWIGYLQYLLSKQRSQLDLYDKRYPVFLATMQYLSFIAEGRNITNEELIKFLRNLKDKEFLFGKDVQQFLDELYKKGVDFLRYKNILNDHNLPMEKREKLVDEEAALFEWFLKQFDESRSIFKKYLAIDKK